MAAAFIAVACSGKSATPATEAVEEAQEVQIEAIDSTAVEVEAEWESTEETTEEVTEETTTYEVTNYASCLLYSERRPLRGRRFCLVLTSP